MNLRDLAVRVTILDALAGRVQSALLQARAELNSFMQTGDRLTVDSPTKVRLAAVTKAEGRTSARVTNEAAFMAWVEQHHPDEVVVTKAVRRSFADAVLASSRKAEQPCAPDGTLDIPGITVSTGEPGLQLRTTEDSSAEIERLWNAGAIDLRSMLELPGGESDG